MQQIHGLKNESIAILLAFLPSPGVWCGVGHLYVGRIGKGLIIMATQFALVFGGLFILFSLGFATFPSVNMSSQSVTLSNVIFIVAILLEVGAFGHFIWQIFDVRKCCREHNQDIMRAYYQPHVQPVAAYGPYPGVRR